MHRRLVTAILSTAFLAAILAAGVIGSGRSPEAAAPAAPAPESHAVPPAGAERVVLVSRTVPAASAPGPSLRVRYVSGGLAGVHLEPGTVVTDADCAPDATGLSHCLNRIRMADGRMLPVRHPHRMAEVPGLAPGERVAVRLA